MISDQSRHFFGSLLVISHFACYSVPVHKAKSSCTSSLLLSDKPTWHFTKMDNWNRDLANKDESATKKLKVTFKSSLSEIMEEIANCGNVDTVVYVNFLWRKKWRCPRSEDDIKKFPRIVKKKQKLSELFHDIKSSKDKILKADWNLEMSMIILQSLEKILTLYHCCLIRQVLFKIPLISFLQRNRTL